MDRLALVLALLLASAPALGQPFPAEIMPPRWLYEEARKAELDGNSSEAVRLYIRAARAGDGKAAYRLGEIYEKGIAGVARDDQESLTWFKVARQLGYPPFVGDFPPGFVPRPPTPPPPTTR